MPDRGVIKIKNKKSKIKNTNQKSKIISAIRMADISEKPATKRAAVAEAIVCMKPATIKSLKAGTLPKGDPIACARVAGIMAAKKTPEIIPLCHPLEISNVKIEFKILKGSVIIKSEVSCLGRTGVEMEALTAVSAAALTVYDMCKPVDKDMVISEIKLLKKTGGKSGEYVRE